MILLRLAAICLLITACGGSQEENLAPNPDPPAESGREFKVVHVYVALCDNASQGIAPVPARIGNGDDPANNLYWGCSDGSRPVFSKSPHWKRIHSGKVADTPEILERLVFQHTKTRALLVVDAWRGMEIKPCMVAFCKAMAGQQYETLAMEIDGKPRRINLAGGADFLTFIGHNGLMEFRVPKYPANPKRKQPVAAALLCCKSHSYFTGHLEAAGVEPVLMTASNMYPGAFILHDALEGWFAGKDSAALRQLAAQAYAKNQKISTRAALTVFAELPDKNLSGQE
jgi:hypothetical protein